MNEGLKAKNFEDLIKRLNPFGFRQENGDSMTFADYGKLYLYTLKRLKSAFPKGYIDLPLFLHDMTKCPLSTAVRFVNKFTLITTDRGVCLCPWEDEKSNPKYTAEMIMRSLHTLSETKFSTDYYNWAWDKFVSPEETSS